MATILKKEHIHIGVQSLPKRSLPRPIRTISDYEELTGTVGALLVCVGSP